MNDSDVGYDAEWNGWKRPDLTNELGWVRVYPNGLVEKFQTWNEALKSSGGSLMSEEYYNTEYKNLKISK